jgi:hypothetical protein
MTITDALELLGSKALISQKAARQICDLAGVDFKEDLIKQWELIEGREVVFFQAYGFLPTTYGPGSGVDCMELSYHIADQLDLRNAQGHLPGYPYTGAGFQAKANSRAIAQELCRRGMA